jgi:hypothetical protein
VRGNAVSFVACAAIVLVSCGRDSVPVPRVERAAPTTEPTTAVATSAPASDATVIRAVERERCRQRLAALEHDPVLPGDPVIELHRAETFARAKAHGVLFVRPLTPGRLSPEASRLRRSIETAEDPVRALYEVYPKLGKRREVAREALLTEGYVYSTNPAFASALSALVKPEDLFDAPEIYIQRGGETFRARRVERDEHGSRDDSHYVYAEGPLAGERVKVLLFDRVTATAEELAAPLHRDVEAARRALGFDEFHVRHLSEHALSADLRYGDVRTQAMFSSDGARLAFDCEVVAPESEASLVATRELSRRHEHVMERLRAVIDEQVREALPFDEPKTEVGQQDGKLRQNWVWAYRYGRTQFDFNEDTYKVFDASGRPRVPQVCIDFITDTFERAGGSWYGKRGEPRERSPGRIDFRALGIDNERSVERFIEFAKTHPEWFDVIEVEEKDRVPYAHRAEFFSHLERYRERYQPGDVVTIYGLRDDGKMHYHSFFVYSSDPVTGSPSLVAANAGRPRIRPWESEMLTAPQRSIRARIRPKLEWLESVTSMGRTLEAAGVVPPPVAPIAPGGPLQPTTI